MQLRVACTDKARHIPSVAREVKTVKPGPNVAKSVGSLPELLRRNAQRSNATELSAEDQRQLFQCLEEIRTFVLRICIYEADTPKLAAFACQQVCCWLFDLANLAASENWIQSAIGRMRLQPGLAKQMLFLEVLKVLAGLRNKNTEVMLNLATIGDLPPAELFRKPSSAVQELLKNGCYLKEHKPRGPTRAALKSFRLPYGARPESCVRGCDVQFLHELGFGIREIGAVLRVPKSTVDRAMGECYHEFLAIKGDASAKCGAAVSERS